MMCRFKRFWGLTGFCAVLGSVSVTHAETLTVLTEEFPPYNYTDHGQLTGFSTEVVRAVLQEAKIDGLIQSQPWARAYETAKDANSVLIYSIARTVQREKLFKWVGVIAPTQYYLFSLPQRKLQFTQLEQAKNYQIATVNEDVGEQFLISKGFQKGKNLQSSVKYELNYEKLKLGRVDLWIMTELVAAYLSRQAGDEPAQTLASSYAIPELSDDGLYMAFGTKTPDALVERLRKALATLKANGSYDALKKKWL
ncbi:MAG: amino acid ABC transporter substrate-binding protein [Burkholderiales bacterium RIFOXYC12_FULL_60_6]|nr:MAG: amino acid ABC transporter substrate-binding protein [Burkholderiales bacterium RIFOXYD12_FULL_59_19]OGB81794.1 MAG: amino acid ABC transporter substrate-binding protein [Burkholderiales bacterium RIFOXYC12_FULL_60_6]